MQTCAAVTTFMRNRNDPSGFDVSISPYEGHFIKSIAVEVTKALHSTRAGIVFLIRQDIEPNFVRSELSILF